MRSKAKRELGAKGYHGRYPLSAARLDRLSREDHTEVSTEVGEGKG